MDSHATVLLDLLVKLVLKYYTANQAPARMGQLALRLVMGSYVVVQLALLVTPVQKDSVNQTPVKTEVLAMRLMAPVAVHQTIMETCVTKHVSVTTVVLGHKDNV